MWDIAMSCQQLTFPIETERRVKRYNGYVSPEEGIGATQIIITFLCRYPISAGCCHVEK